MLYYARANVRWVHANVRDVRHERRNLPRKREDFLPKRKRKNRRISSVNNKKTRLAKKLKSITDEFVRGKMIAMIKETLAQTFATPYQEPMDAEYRRIQYVRYADDFFIGIIGSKTECIKIKADIVKFMAEKLRWELSEEKTLITNAHDKAKFLWKG